MFGKTRSRNHARRTSWGSCGCEGNWEGMRDVQGCLSAESGDATGEGDATNKAAMVRKTK